jgi:hypothetical protein
MGVVCRGHEVLGLAWGASGELELEDSELLGIIS